MEEAESAITTVTPKEAADAQQAGAALIVDIRDVRERGREGFVPDALHMPRGMLEFWVDPASPYFKKIFEEDKQFIFHCASGWRSALAAHTLQEMGLEKVAHIGGGFKAWKQSGLPVSTD